MRYHLRKIKDKLYYYLVEKNFDICKEYKPYVLNHQEEHRTKPWRHWWLLICLNIHYRILNYKSQYIKIHSPQKNIISPYIGAPESQKGNRMDVYHFAAGLMNYDVISFDIFDTLILRKFNKPDELFMLVGKRLDIFNFISIRKKAESEAREFNRTIIGNNEVTIEQIYERVAYYTGISAQIGIEVELSVERDMCFANPYMYEVFQILKFAGKKIYVTSNMYIQKPDMEKLLNSCGYFGFKDILVSCDYNCGKTNGALFKILKSKLKDGDSIVHVGDSVAADVKGAEKAGIVAKYYKSCRDLGDIHRSPGQSPLISAAYRGIINTELHNGIEQHSRLWEYGFIYGGIIGVGYANWIHEKAIQDGVTKILFLARDGYIIKKAYDMFYQDIPSDYLFWSRLAALRNVSSGEREPFLTRLFAERCDKGNTIAEVMELAGISSLEGLMIQHKIDPSLPLLKEYLVPICNVLVENWNLVEEALASIQLETIDYVRRVLKGHEKIAIVDLGWTGRNLGSLKKVLVKAGLQEKNIKRYMLGSICKHQNATEIITDNISCYMFSAQYNRDIHGRFCKESVVGLEAVEKLFSAPHNSFISCDKNKKMEFAIAEIENYGAYYEIEDGILSFVKQYKDWFSKYKYLYHISGYDAYIPIRILFNNKNALQKIIGEMTYNEGISPNKRAKLTKVVK